MMIDEHELLTKWAAGGIRGELAFNKLYAKYDAKIRKDAKRIGGVPDDTSQDVWLRLTEARNNGKLPSYGSFEAYLLRLTQMACGRDAPNAGEPAAVPLHTITSGEIPVVSSAEDVVEAGQLAERAATAMDRMSEEVKAAWGHKRRGDSNTFAAKQLGISVPEYKRRVADARAIIQETLAKVG